MLDGTSSQLLVMNLALFLSVSFTLECSGEKNIQETDRIQM